MRSNANYNNATALGVVTFRIFKKHFILKAK